MSNFTANKTVLLPYDFSDAANAAIDEALGMVDETSKIFVVHVLMPLNIVSPEPGFVEDVAYDPSYREGALKRMKQQIKDPLNRMFFAVRIGDPGSEIVQFANEVHADFIIMPSHGRTGISRLFLGSVAERVLRLAECPVMVLRHPKPAES